MRTNLRMKDIPLSQRPREKLFEKGVENLTDSELIAILFGTGSKTKNALSLANTFLKQYPMQKLSAIKLSSQIRVSGIGKGKFARVLASLELGKRLFALDTLTETNLATVSDVINQVKDIIAKKQEYLVVLYANARFQLIQKEIVAVGKLNALAIEPKELFAPAFSLPCYGIIIVHNHPSGDVTPSDEDIQFTANIQKAGELLGIILLDHVVISPKQYYSFKENKIGKIKEA